MRYKNGQKDVSDSTTHSLVWFKSEATSEKCHLSLATEKQLPAQESDCRSKALTGCEDETVNVDSALCLASRTPEKNCEVLKQRKPAVAETGFPCEECDRIFSRKCDLRRHSKWHVQLKDEAQVSDNDTSDKCLEADVQPNPETSLESSIKDESKLPASNTYHCIECGKHFKLKDSYFRHMRIHTGEKPFTCHVCGKQFRDSGGLARHLKDVHARIKNFTCDLCGRSFASKATREDHRRIHTGERPYICDSCGKMFKSKASLYIHSKIHTDLFPHECTYCKKRFRRRQELLAHVTTHTGVKPHACEECGRCFRVRGELLRHKLVHSEDKPYVCSECGLSFRQKRYLKNHEKTRHVVRERNT